MAVFTELARAKVNLTLKVLGKRPDGFHELASLVAFADAADVITLDNSKPVSVSVSGPFGSGISGQNLIEVTLRRLADEAHDLALGAVHLEKLLPVAAGIGGGSADAAAVLRAIRRANPDRAASVDWLALAQSLGADVPVCFLNQTSWMTGFGDRITPVNLKPTLHAVLVNPLKPMPPDKTARVFRALNARALSPDAIGQCSQPGALKKADDLISFMRQHGNDLEAAASRDLPFVDDVKRALRAAPGCQYAAISGAGPTGFGVFENADVAAAKLSAARPHWWVKAVTLGDRVSASG